MNAFMRGLARRPIDAGWYLVSAVACAGAIAVLGAPSLLVPSQALIDLAGSWAFRGGDDAAWAETSYDDTPWVRIEVPGSWGRQGLDSVRELAWYRKRVVLPERPTAAAPWGVALGKVDSAYEVYAGGRKLGGVGAMPPEPRMEYDRHRIWALPAGAVDADRSVVLAIRVWRAPGKAPGAAGLVGGAFLVGPLSLLERKELGDETPQLCMVLVFFLVGLYHVVLRHLRQTAAEYGWFGLASVIAAVFSLLRTQWKYVLWDDFVDLKKLEHLMLYLFPVVIVQFLWIFFREPIPRWLRALQLALLVAGTTVLIAPGLHLALRFLPWLILTGLGVGIACLVLVARHLDDSRSGARAVAVGVLLVVVTVGHDSLVDRGLLVAPRIATFGFGALVASMSFSLAFRFHRVLDDLDLLTRDLEDRVAQRTLELGEAYQRMEELAQRDALTGVMNRGAIQQRALAGLDDARRSGLPFAVALVDVDHFKTINDGHGHAAGDQALVHVTQRLARALRVGDEVGRWGGEEFLILLPGCGLEQALPRVERLRERIAAEPVQFGIGNAQYLTISAGVSATRDPATSLTELIRRADASLYNAKSGGRNRVCGDPAPPDSGD
jgi:diguanylate cyclase (GGDEF)-like protein